MSGSVRPRPPRAAARLLRAAVASLPLASCGGGAAAAFGPEPATARVHSNEFFGALASRFENVYRTPRFTAARDKISQSALSPSRLVRDNAIWTSNVPGGWHTLEVVAGPDGGRYVLDARANAPAPARPGQAHHAIRLAPVSNGVYRWNTAVDYGVGRVRAADLAAATTAGLARLERPEPQVRAELRATLPRTSAVLGRLLTLDAVRSEALPDGSTRIEVRSVLRPDRLAATMPAFASYVRKYISRSRLSADVGDGRDGRWLDFRSARDTVVVRMRLQGGRLLALDGPARPLPATAQLRANAMTRYLRFDIGATNLVGELTTLRGPHERGWQVRWRRPPSWHLPLGMRHLINASLSRPFANDGMQMTVAMRDGNVGQTVLYRRFDVTVQESAIVRWLGGLGSSAMSDLAGRAEVEQDRYFAELLRAVAADVSAALPR